MGYLGYYDYPVHHIQPGIFSQLERIGSIDTSEEFAHFTNDEKLSLKNLLLNAATFSKSTDFNNYYNKSEIDDKLSEYIKVIPEQYVTEQELNIVLNRFPSSDDFNAYYNKNEIDAKLLKYTPLSKLNDYVELSDYLSFKDSTNNKLSALDVTYISNAESSDSTYEIGTLKVKDSNYTIYGRQTDTSEFIKSVDLEEEVTEIIGPMIPDPIRNIRAIVYTSTGINSVAPKTPIGGSVDFDNETIIEMPTSTDGVIWSTEYTEPAAKLRVWSSSAMFYDKDGSAPTWSTPVEIVDGAVLLQRVPTYNSYGVSVYTSYDGNFMSGMTPNGGEFDPVDCKLVKMPHAESGAMELTWRPTANLEDLSGKDIFDKDFKKPSGMVDGDFLMVFSRNDDGNRCEINITDEDDYNVAYAAKYKLSSDGCIYHLNNDNIPKYRSGITMAKGDFVLFSFENTMDIVTDSEQEDRHTMLDVYGYPDSFSFLLLEPTNTTSVHTDTQLGVFVNLSRRLVTKSIVKGLDLVEYNISFGTGFDVFSAVSIIFDEHAIIVGDISLFFSDPNYSTTVKWQDTLEGLTGTIWVSYNNYIVNAKEDPKDNAVESETGWTEPVRYLDIRGIIDAAKEENQIKYDNEIARAKTEIQTYSDLATKAYQEAAKELDNAKILLESIDAGEVDAIGLQQLISAIKGEIRNYGWSTATLVTPIKVTDGGLPFNLTSNTPYFANILANITVELDDDTTQVYLSNKCLTDTFDLVISGISTKCYLSIDHGIHSTLTGYGVTPLVKTVNTKEIVFYDEIDGFYSYPESYFRPADADEKTNYYFNDIYDAGQPVTPTFISNTGEFDVPAPQSNLTNYAFGEIYGIEIESGVDPDGNTTYDNVYYSVLKLDNDLPLKYTNVYYFPTCDIRGVLDGKFLGYSNGKYIHSSDAKNKVLFIGTTSNTDGKFKYVEEMFNAVEAHWGVTAAEISTLENEVKQAKLSVTPDAILSAVSKVLPNYSYATESYVKQEASRIEASVFEVNNTKVSASLLYQTPTEMMLSVLSGDDYKYLYDVIIRSAGKEILNKKGIALEHTPIVVEHVYCSNKYTNHTLMCKAVSPFNDVRQSQDTNVPLYFGFGLIVLSGEYEGYYLYVDEQLGLFRVSSSKNNRVYLFDENSSIDNAFEEEDIDTNYELVEYNVYVNERSDLPSTFRRNLNKDYLDTRQSLIQLTDKNIRLSVVKKEDSSVKGNKLTGASFEIGINDGKNTSYAELNADTFTITGDIIAEAIYADDLNINNTTYLLHDGTTQFAMGKDKQSSEFKYDGTGYIAGGLILWGYGGDAKKSQEEASNDDKFTLKVKGIVDALGGKIGNGEKCWTITESNIISPETETEINELEKINTFINLDAKGGKIRAGSKDDKWNGWTLSSNGSGELANGQISWDSKGNVTFGNNVTVNAKLDANAFKSKFIGIGNTDEDLTTVNSADVNDNYGLSTWFNLDGSGAVAKGNIWWDNAGDLHVKNAVGVNYITNNNSSVTITNADMWNRYFHKATLIESGDELEPSYGDDLEAGQIYELDIINSPTVIILEYVPNDIKYILLPYSLSHDQGIYRERITCYNSNQTTDSTKWKLLKRSDILSVINKTIYIINECSSGNTGIVGVICGDPMYKSFVYQDTDGTTSYGEHYEYGQPAISSYRTLTNGDKTYGIDLGNPLATQFVKSAAYKFTLVMGSVYFYTPGTFYPALGWLIDSIGNNGSVVFS